jgi:hypothetical protein
MLLRSWLAARKVERLPEVLLYPYVLPTPMMTAHETKAIELFPSS